MLPKQRTENHELKINLTASQKATKPNPSKIQFAPLHQSACNLIFLFSYYLI